MTRTPQPSRRWLALVATLLLLVTACGDDGGGDDDGDAETLSQAEFVARFSERCTEIDEQLSDLPSQTREDAIESSEQAQQTIADGVADLRALTPPDDLADDVAEGLELLAQTEENAAAIGAAAEADDPEAAAQAAESTEELRARAGEILAPLGIECGFDADVAGSVDGDGTDANAGDVPVAGGELPDPEPASSVADYGSNPVLDNLAGDCEAGDLTACDGLFGASDIGSAYEEYGNTCGGRNEPIPDQFCERYYGE